MPPDRLKLSDRNAVFRHNKALAAIERPHDLAAPGAQLTLRDPSCHDEKCGTLTPDRHPPVSYTFGMKTAVSLPNDVFQEAERLARRLKKPRSRLYSDAVREYVARRDPELVTTKLNEVVKSVGGRGDAFTAVAARSVLERVDW